MEKGSVRIIRACSVRLRTKQNEKSEEADAGRKAETLKLLSRAVNRWQARRNKRLHEARQVRGNLVKWNELRDAMKRVRHENVMRTSEEEMTARWWRKNDGWACCFFFVRVVWTKSLVDTNSNQAKRRFSSKHRELNPFRDVEDVEPANVLLHFHNSISAYLRKWAQTLNFVSSTERHHVRQFKMIRVSL